MSKFWNAAFAFIYGPYKALLGALVRTVFISRSDERVRIVLFPGEH